MALPSSGIISLSAINVELGKAANAPISLNDPDVRALLGKASGAIGLSDSYGKSNNAGNTHTMVVGSSGTGAYGYDTGMVAVYGTLNPKSITIDSVLQPVTGFVFDSTNNTTWILLDWGYARIGDLYVTYNGTKYRFVQDSGFPGWFLYSGVIPGMFTNGQSRSFAVTTS